MAHRFSIWPIQPSISVRLLLDEAILSDLSCRPSRQDELESTRQRLAGKEFSMSILLSWLILTVSFWVTSAILPGFNVKGFGGAMRIAAIFGILNWALGKLIFGLIVVATLFIGLLLTFVTRVIVNAILLKLTDAISDSLEIKGFWHAILGSIVMSGIGTVAEALFTHSFH